MLTADAVIRKRLAELNLEHNTLAAEAMDISVRLKEIEQRMLEIKVEEDVFESYQERGNITHTVTTTHTTTVTGKVHDKLKIDDALRSIFDAEGKPLKFGEIRSKLESFEFTWNHYGSAHAAISKMLEPTGAYGYYNYRR